VYTPAAQPQADMMYQNILNNVLGPLAMNPSQTPAGQNLPAAQAATYNNIVNNPGFGGALGAMQTAYSPSFNAYQNAIDEMPFLQGGGSDLVNQARNNPFYQQAQGGAQTAAQIGGQAAPLAANVGNSLFNLMPQYYGQIPGLQAAGNQILQTGFDPQNALYDRTLNQVRNQTGVNNAFSGVNNSPYGADVTGNALSNFNIDWQNNLLNRQATAGQADNALQQGALALGTGIGNLGQQGLGINQGAANLAAGSAALPSNVFTGNQAQIAQALQQAGNLYSGSQSLQGQGLQNLLQGTSPAFNLYNTQGGNVLSGLSNLTNLGNNQYQLPQQTLNDLQSYLQLGQAASGISGNLGSLGLQEQQNAMSGFGQLAGGANNVLFGSQGIGGANGLLGGAGGLFGGGGGIPVFSGDLGATAAAAGDFAGAGGAGDVAASALPFAASA
jgi:hypothetical protein